MKNALCFCLVFAVVCSFCGCGNEQKTEEIQTSYGIYSDLIDRLEAGEYEAARRMIYEMEGIIPTEAILPTKEQDPPAAQTEAPKPVFETENTLPAEYETVELNRYNVNDYFELREQYFVAELSRYVQYITLKEEYRDRLVSAENVKLELTYLVTDAYGSIDQKAERFDVDYFDITSGTAEQKIISVQDCSRETVFQSEYSAKRGCFRDFPMDTEIVFASGSLIFSKL